MDRATILDMRKIQEIVVKLSYFGFTRTCGEVVVSDCHVIPSPISLIGCPVKSVGTANLVVKLSVTPKFRSIKTHNAHRRLHAQLHAQHNTIHSYRITYNLTENSSFVDKLL